MNDKKLLKLKLADTKCLFKIIILDPCVLCVAWSKRSEQSHSLRIQGAT